MIRVTIELVPHGNEKEKEVIATGTIINDGTGDWQYGNYDYKFSVVSVDGKILNFNRTKNVWALLHECLNDSLLERTARINPSGGWTDKDGNTY